MSSESIDEETVWVGNVPSGYREADVLEDLQRHDIPRPVSIKVCPSTQDNQFAFLYYQSRRLAASVIALGQSAVVWKKTKKYGFFKARSFFLLIHSRCCVLLASEQFTGDHGFL